MGSKGFGSFLWHLPIFGTALQICNWRYSKPSIPSVVGVLEFQDHVVRNIQSLPNEDLKLLLKHLNILIFPTIHLLFMFWHKKMLCNYARWTDISRELFDSTLVFNSFFWTFRALCFSMKTFLYYLRKDCSFLTT